MRFVVLFEAQREVEAVVEASKILDFE